jgi:hypothetical protein
MAALAEHGPCPEHRASFANVVEVIRSRAGLPVATIREPPGGQAQEPAGEEAEWAYG